MQGIGFSYSFAEIAQQRLKNITIKPTSKHTENKTKSSGERKRPSVSKVGTMDYLKCPAFHNNNNRKYETPKERGLCDLYTGKVVTESAFERTQMLD